MAGLYDIIAPTGIDGDHVCSHTITDAMVLVDNGTITGAQARTMMEELSGFTMDAATITDLTDLLVQLAAAPDKALYLRNLQAVMDVTEQGATIASEAAFRNVLGI